MKLLQFIMVAAALVAGSNSFAGKNSVEKIIGTNDLIAVSADGSNIPERYREIIEAFGIIDMGCTATHIGNGYVLTAGHCFDAPVDVVRDQACAGTSISWGVRDGKSATSISQCESIVAMQLTDSQDFAILKVSPVPAAAVGVDIERRAEAGDQLTIFSHPEMLPLRWSQNCVVEADKHPDLSQDSIHHKCDTNPGSSGATILNLKSLKVIGIHDGGLTSGGGMNYGTYITNSPIPEVLKQLGF